MAYFPDVTGAATLPDMDVVLDDDADSWQSILLDFVTEPGVSEMLLPINMSYAGNEGATIYIDDAWVYNLGAAGDLVTDGGFESFDVGELTVANPAPELGDNWALGLSNDAAATFSIVDSSGGEVHSGNQALAVEITASSTDLDQAYNIEVARNNVNSQPNSTYTLTVWMFGPAGAEAHVTVGTPPDEYAERGRTEVVMNGDWQEVTVAVTTESDNEGHRIPIHLNFATNVGETIYIDDIFIE